MSKKGEVKIAINLEKFVNIELFKQGIYQIRIKLYYTYQNKLSYAKPIFFWFFSKKLGRSDPNYVSPSYIQDTDHSYCSCSFLIRYQKEKFNLNELCVFLCEVPLYLSSPLFLEAELLYDNLDFQAEAESPRLKLADRNANLKPVSVKRYIIANIWETADQYIPLNFEPEYFCVVESVIHIFSSTSTISLDGMIKRYYDSNINFLEFLKATFHYKSRAYFNQFISDEELNEGHNPIDRKIKVRNLRFRLKLHLNPEPSFIYPEHFFSKNINFQPIFVVENSNDILGETAFQPQEIDDNPYWRVNDIYLLVLVHGFQGSSHDMTLIKGYLSHLYPNLTILNSKFNENLSNHTIGFQGKNLATEINQFLRVNNISLSRLKVSFLAHSLGGLIVRAALPHLAFLKNNMYCLITLSTPHLGLVASWSPLFEFGKWLIKKWQNSRSFEQMSLSDTSLSKRSYIYELSKTPGLEYFEKIVLFSSPDDIYVSQDSARIENSQNYCEDPIYREMINNIYERVNKEKVTKIDVHFKQTSLGKMLVCCRNRHIDFIDNPYFVKMLCYSFPKLFLQA
ncbi:unnamed protein product [Blepharisma stoltei]|uniref:DUF676 domain-containing protein n=1 Tax=Blepharisma stoltei TaxID=1481888 RepID=A0AAU9IZ67_9CILI|nr:unnamed protein product [Blepharisma stoltei]